MKATGAGRSQAVFSPDPEQRSVIEAGADQWLLVVAGPGTGKTQVAAMRLVHLLRSGLLPAQILVLSFSRSAVATLTRRIRNISPAEQDVVEDLRHLSIRTFDSWAFRSLRQNGGVVSELLGRPYEANIAAVSHALRDSANPEFAYRLRTIRHVIVDEFQDLPGVRAQMVTDLLGTLNDGSHPPVGFTVLGDPVQAIYGFAARTNGVPATDPWSDLKTRFAGKLQEIELKTNHRATEKLAFVASQMRKVMGRAELAPEKKLAAMHRLLEGLPTSDGKVKLGPEWLTGLPRGSVAILTRTNREAIRVAKMLLGNENDAPTVPVCLRLAGERPVVPAWIALLLGRQKTASFTRSTFDAIYAAAVARIGLGGGTGAQIPPVDLAWRRLARASGEADTASSIKMENLRERLDWPDAFPDDQIPEDAGVYVTNIHQAKGMEFDNVSLLETNAHVAEKAQENPLEEANVGFVAITRAGRQLTRIPASSIYAPPNEWKARDGRKRYAGWGKMTSMQIGLPGDIDATSFVDAGLHGGTDEITSLQKFLAESASRLRGRKVILVRVDSGLGPPGRADIRFNVHVQEDQKEGLLLARTSQIVTWDLLQFLGAYTLPATIYNLRVSEVVTMVGRGDIGESVADPWRTSRIWLGVSLFGTGDFKTRKKGGSS